jgi:hypothetical protein
MCAPIQAERSATGGESLATARTSAVHISTLTGLPAGRSADLSEIWVAHSCSYLMFLEDAQMRASKARIQSARSATLTFDSTWMS